MDEQGEAYVWAWLPGETEPVVCGRLVENENITLFNYGRSYLDRPEAISLFTPELPLKLGVQPPLAGLLEAGCIRDAGPDSWGQRVILQRLTGSHGASAMVEDLSFIDYLLNSGSDRSSAIDFQCSSTEYVARTNTSSLDELVDAAQRVAEGLPVSAELSEALLYGTSMGGARPKVLVRGESFAGKPREMIAKLSVASDPWPVVKAEAAAMNLARRCGMNVASTELTTSLGRDVLLVDRFDRPGVVGSVAGTVGERRMTLSALTLLGLSPMQGVWASYADLAEVIRFHFTQPKATLKELFTRIVFNVCISNTDDHARNHAAFWDGEQLTLTPAFDLCPQMRSGDTATQAMAIDSNGSRESRLALCVAAASIYQLSTSSAREIIDQVVTTIMESWDEVADESALTVSEREQLFGRLILNPAIHFS